MRYRFLMKSGLSLLLVVLWATAAFGQATSVSGTVVDPQGNLVAGATIILTNSVTGASRTVTTSKDGSFQIPQVNPGTYSVKAEAQGFATLVQEKVVVLVSTPLTLRLGFTQVGAVTETVTIQAGEATINQSDATLGNTFSTNQVSQLPLSARNVVNLLTLQPGVTQGGYVNGGRADQANITLDGVDVNDQQSGTPLFAVLRSTPDSLQEFRVTTTNPNADQGRSSGAQIALLTKSGSNAFHGSLYEYHRNTITSANDWFNNASGVPRPQLLRNNFGGSIGGPIKRDRIFFFFNYEGFREAAGQTVERQVPLPNLGAGLVRYRSKANGGINTLNVTQINNFYLGANGVTPGINPAALAVLADAARRYPSNSTGTGDQLNTSGFRFNANTPTSQNTYIGRFDANINSRQGVFLRLNYQNDVSVGVRRFPDTPAPTNWNHPKGIAVGHYATLSSNISNNIRYGITRDSFTLGGDSNQNSIFFRFIFQPLAFSRALNRTTPVHNIVDDLSWTKGNHAMQFGTNIRLITNSRTSFGGSFDLAITNPSFYDFSGRVVLFKNGRTSQPIFPDVGGSVNNLRDALTAIIGRYTQYNTNLNYNNSGALQGVGSGVTRDFATQEYEFYGQDSWRVRPNIMLTYGLRWSTSTPVYEKNGIEVAPQPGLASIFDQRIQGMQSGKPFNGTIIVDRAGKVNNRKGYYNQDWNNFAPSFAVAWSPHFENSWLKAIFGAGDKSVFRSGFRTTYDRIGSQLAVSFDGGATLGFHSTSSISANTFNVSSRLGPVFTAFGQDIRNFPFLSNASSLKFPLKTPADQQQRIESSLDDSLVTPVNYSVNLSFEREIGKGITFQASYVGRFARNLLLTRDIMHLNNLVDPKSGQDWYTAIGKLVNRRYANAPIGSVKPLPFFEHFFPGLANAFVGGSATQNAYAIIAKDKVGGFDIIDYTFVQAIIDDGFGTDNAFFHPQYAAFSAFSTVGSSAYNSGQISIRKRFSNDTSFDFNYTLSHSLDNASGLQTSGAFGSAFVVNPLDLRAQHANSDFDVRHLINANFIAGLPFGKGKKFLNGVGPVMNQFVGGWQVTGIYRYNTGFPSGQPFDGVGWSTNWNLQSNGVAIRPIKSSPTRSGDPNLFSDPTAALRSFRDSRPGEPGDRNNLRYPGFFTIDTGVYKTFRLPGGETKKLVFRWEVFNLTNTQSFTGISAFALDEDPFLGGVPSAGFGKFTGTQGTPRIMQFALRFEF